VNGVTAFKNGNTSAKVTLNGTASGSAVNLT
jgi:hypothetical protein